MVEADKLYDAHRTAVFEFVGKWLKTWDALTSRERDQWQATAYEVNCKDREVLS